MQRCAHCGHYGRRNRHCSPRKTRPRRKTPRLRQCAHRNDKKRGTLPTECSIPPGTPRYSYKPFEDTNSIRLLVLLPGDKWRPVRCELVVQSLDIACYEALSYVWGPAEERGDILCHGQRVKVPWSLEHALRKFRRLRKKRILWADSVCINQDDIPERCQQVQNMAKVYENAMNVLVWLGRGSRSDPSRSYRPHSNPSDLFEFIRSLGPLPPPDDQSTDYVDYQIEKCGNKHWSTFRSLNNTGWFNRLWIIQEICLADRAIVHFGPASMDWEPLASFCIYMAVQHDEAVQAHRLGLASHIFLLEGLNFQNPNTNILSVLNQGRSAACSDPRDRIYAFLGHSALLNTISNPQSKLFLPVDYSISHKDLYTSVAVRILQDEAFSSLHIINFVSHDQITIHDHGISSWVPRWDLWLATPFIETLPCEDEWMAHGQTTAQVSLKGDCLSVTGLAFDSAVWVSDTFVISTAYFPAEPLNASLDLNAHPFGQAWNHIRRSGGANVRDMLEAMCISMARKMPEDKRFIRGAVAYAYQMGLDISGLEDLVGFEHEQFFLEWVTYDERRIFVTSRGWIGLGPEATLPGDDVCIFFGAHTPFVARKLPSASESLYRLCGPCRIPGIMQGEAVEMWESGTFEETIFNII